MNILVACEFSGLVRDAFTARGHNAVSCDLLASERPGYHIQGDVTPLLTQVWDMVIAFPPCDNLASSGAAHYAIKRLDGRLQASIDFFMLFTRLDCPRVVIENPVGLMSNLYRKPDQYIQPWEHGHGEPKKTCLWLKGVPELQPSNIVPIVHAHRIENVGHSLQRKKNRSRTYAGIAQAMAEQWSNIT